MLTPNHPDEERLSALAFGDADAKADETLVAHVASCNRCTELTDELGLLRVAMAELPDVAPSRPLRVLPEVEPAASDRLGGWVRRAFGPVMAAGAAIALVGMVGTVAPSFSGAASGMGDVQRSLATDAEIATERVSQEAEAGGAAGLYSDRLSGSNDDGGEAAAAPDASPDSAGEADRLEFTTERSLWPMVLFTGIAVLIAAALLRWILVPRAG